jgi:hypothetical protein
MLKIKLLKDKKIVIESLKRMGIANVSSKMLYPSCYLYEKDQEYFVIHFKEAFKIFSENSFDDMTEIDFERRNAIVYLLKKWGMVDIDEEELEPHKINIYVLPYQEKQGWYIKHKINYNSLCPRTDA